MKPRQCVRAGGFTLIEIMVVVVILGVMLTVAMPNTQSIASIEQQASLDKFVTTLESAMFASVVGGQPLRLVSNGRGYYFEVRNDEGVWNRSLDQAALMGGVLSDEVRIEQAWQDNKLLQLPLRIEFIGAAPPLLRFRLRDGQRVLELETTGSGGVVQTVI